MGIRMPLRVLLADDDDVVRAGVRMVLEREADLEVVAEAADGRAALELADALAPDFVLLDIGMPGLNGLDAAKQFIARPGGAKVIILSMHADRQMVTEALKAGVVGYLLKDCAARELPAAIRAAAAGKTFLSPAIANLVVEDFVRHVPD